MLNVNLGQIDIFALTETNLDPSIGDAELGFTQYSVFRCDRSRKTSIKSSGGGVLLAVHKDLNASSMIFPCDEIEATCAVVKCGRNPLLICSVYIPPNQPVTVFQSLCDALEQLHLQVGPDFAFALLGDFNLNSAVSTGMSSDLLYDMAGTLGLRQQSEIVNERSTQLDLVFSDLSCSVARSRDPVVIEDIYHPALDIVLSLQSPAVTPQYTFSPNYYKCNIAQLREDINNLNLAMEQSELKNENAFNTYITELSGLIKRNSPMKRVGRSPFPRWFNQDLKAMVINKKTLHRIYKSTGFESDYMAFARARNACKALAFGCYNSYISHVDRSITSNPKVFWSHVKNLRRNDTIPSRMTLGNSESSDPNEMCNLFASHFSSVFSEPIRDPPVIPPRANNVFLSQLKCSPVDVKKKMDVLDTSKGVGPDCIPPLVLRYCSDLLCGPISRLFNLSLQEGFFPSSLKTSYVVPVFKDGNRATASCYRPITIQSPVTKILESLVLDNLKPLLSSVLLSQQHGFTRGRSTVTNLIQYEEFILSAFTEYSQVDSIYLDFSKAFDKVNHSLLISKLESYGVYDPLLSWLRSYLTGRSSVVRFGGGVSDPFSVKSGVPQGSLLGPYLFNLFINDIGEVIESNFLLFADDIKLFGVLKRIEDGLVLQRSLNSVYQWCEENFMQLNKSKCMVMSFYRGDTFLQTDYYIQGTRLQQVNIVKDLGVYLSETLSPDHHVDVVCNRASRLLGLLSRAAKSGLSVHSIATLYKSLLRPILEYASVVWRPMYLHHVIRLERIQRKFIRLIGSRLGMPFLDVPVEDLMRQLDICPLEARRELADLAILFKLVNGILDCPDLLAMINFRIPRTTRSTELFIHKQYRTNYLKFGPVARLHRIGNSVPAGVDLFFNSLKTIKLNMLSAPP